MTLWTPGGEHVPDREPSPAPFEGPLDDPDLSPEDEARFAAMQDELTEVRAQLLQAPAAVVVANHAMGLYELAAIHLTAEAPRFVEASLAIDALAALVDGLPGRLGEAEATLRDALTQLRAAYIEVRSRTADDAPNAWA